jgi:phage FluMu protein Com
VEDRLQTSAGETSVSFTSVAMPMSQARCARCGRRLLDYCLSGGQVIIHKVCERCKTLNVFTLGSE